MRKHFYMTLALGLLLSVSGFAQKRPIISGGYSVASYICSNSQVAVWGQNDKGQLGLEIDNPSRSQAVVTIPVVIAPDQFGGLPMQQVSSSFAHFVALSGEVPASGVKTQVWAWGANNRGQVGNGTAGDVVIAPTRVRASAEIDPAYKETVGTIDYLVGASFVFAGSTCSFAILDNGEVVAWGGNSEGADEFTHAYGQLGDGTQVDKTEAVYVRTSATTRLQGVKEVCAGDNSAYALVDTDGDGVGTMYSWGFGNQGTLGRAVGNIDNIGQIPVSTYATPVNYQGQDGSLNDMPMNNIISIACGNVGAYAIDVDHFVWAFGNGAWNNNLGIGVNSYSNDGKPRRVKDVGTDGMTTTGFLRAKQVAGGLGFGMAIDMNDRPVAWGGGGCGNGGGGGGASIARLIDAGFANYITRPADDAAPVVQIDRGATCGYYTTANGDIYAFGCGANGLLGTGNTLDAPRPVKLALPMECGMKDLAPQVVIAPKSFTVCETAFTSQVLNSGFLVASNLENYIITWYKDGEKVAEGKETAASVNAAKTYTAREAGTYKVVVKYVGEFGGCNGFVDAEDEITISFFPQEFEVPTDLSYCVDNGEVYVSPKYYVAPTSIANRMYAWYPSPVSTDAIATTIGSKSAFIDVSSLPTGSMKDKTVYVEEVASASGMVSKRTTPACTTTGNSEAILQYGLGIFSSGNASYTGFSVSEEITITELKFLFESEMNPSYPVEVSTGTATISFGIYRAGQRSPSAPEIVPVGNPIGQLSATYDRTYLPGEPYKLLVELTAQGNVTLLPDEYFIGPSTYTGTGFAMGRIYSIGCPLNGNDDATGNIIQQRHIVRSMLPNPTNQSMVFDIKFQVAQQFCDRIPVVLSVCPELLPPTLDSIENITVFAGEVVDAIHFTGTNLDATKVRWTNDNPMIIQLPDTGVGNIPPFVTDYCIKHPEKVTITAIPVAADGVENPDGAVSFTITVLPNLTEPPVLTDISIESDIIPVGCSSDSIRLTAKVGDEVIDPYFEWYHQTTFKMGAGGATGGISSFTTFRADAPRIDSFTVVVFNNKHCQELFRKTITVLTNPYTTGFHLDVTQTKQNVACENDTVVFTALIDFDNPVYKWYDTAGNLMKSDSLATNESSVYLTTVSAPIAQDTTYKFHVVATSATDSCLNEYRDSIFVRVSPCNYNVYGCMDSTSLNYNPLANVDDGSCQYAQDSIFGCLDPKSLNYNPLATILDSSNCTYAEEKHTLLVTIESDVVDVVATIPVESCDLMAGIQIASAVITSISPASENSIIAHWEIMQDGKISNFDVEYTVEKEGLTVFYLSIICKNELRSTDNTTGFTVSAVYDVNFGELTDIDLIETTANNVLVYPNPFTDWLKVVLKDAGTVGITLYSLDGKVLANFCSQSEAQIATSHLPAGTYIVKVAANGEVKTVTVIKK